MQTDKIRSVIIGHAIGDALGVPVEFASREELAENPVTGMMEGGTHGMPGGTWSDDTSMSLCALAALGKQDWTFADVMDNFAAWMTQDAFTPTGETFDVGNTCFNAILDYVHGHKDAESCGFDSALDNGNGSLMRIHPFSLLAYYGQEKHPDWEQLIDRASALTHAHARSRLACKIYTLILMALLDNPCKNSILIALIQAACRYADHPEYRTFSRLLSLQFPTLPADEIRSSGYVVDTLEAAVWCLLTTDSYEACVLKAVNLGEDTDTAAAVAGGLAGALYGYDTIPAAWRNTLLKRDYIEELCTSFSRALHTD